MALKHDRLTYINGSVDANTDTTFFSFQKNWDDINDTPIFGYEVQYFFMSKTKISYVDSSTKTKRLSLEHYCNFSITPLWYFDSGLGNDVGIINGFSLLPSGSNTDIVAPNGSTFIGSTREEYDLLATPTIYFPHLQHPDHTPIVNYFIFWVKAQPDQNIAGGGLILNFGMYSPNETGTITVDTDLYYGI